MNTTTHVRYKLFETSLVRNAGLLVARLLLAGLFLHEGAFLVANFAGASAAMAKLNVPPLLLALTAALQLVAGLAILFGVQLRLAALGLGLFCVATALMFHTNFAVRNELLHFEKDLAITGGMFVLALCGGGGWTITRFWPFSGRLARPPIRPSAA
jgi:putative oxidoreductase